MNIQTTIGLIGLMILTLTSFGFAFTFHYLQGIHRRLSVVREQQDMMHELVMSRLKLLSISEITALREYCIANERYEDAKKLTEMMQRDYEECFGKEGKENN